MGTEYKQGLVSVIMPVYNTASLVGSAIESVLNQSYDHFELLIVDDGSKDRSLEVCNAYAQKDKRVIVMHQENAGQSVARNRALSVATGQYVGFLDSDDAFENDMLEKMVNKMLSEQADIVMSDAATHNVRADSDREEFLGTILRDEIGGQVWRFLFKRSLWEGISFPEGRYAEDAMIIHKLIARAVRVGFVEERLYAYNCYNPSSSSNLQQKRFKNTIDRAVMFIERASWMKQMEITDVCTVRTVQKKAVEFSIGAFGFPKQAGYKQDYKCLSKYIRTQFKIILRNNKISKARKIAVIILYISPGFYRAVFGKLLRKLKARH